MWLDLASYTSNGRSRTLARRASRLVDLLRLSVNASDGQRAYRFSEFADATPEGNLIQLLDGRGSRLLPIALLPPDFPWPNPAGMATDRYLEVVYEDRHYRIFEHSVTVGGHPYVILVGGGLDCALSTLRHPSPWRQGGDTANSERAALRQPIVSHCIYLSFGAGEANRTPDPNLGNGLVCLRTCQKRSPIQPPYSQAWATCHSLSAPTNQQSHAPVLSSYPIESIVSPRTFGSQNTRSPSLHHLKRR